MFRKLFLELTITFPEGDINDSRTKREDKFKWIKS